jgi:RND family efflux transporter MFP subunit
LALGLAAGLLVALGIAGALWWQSGARAVPVRTVAARELAAANGGERTLLNASGYVVARRQATVSAKLTGKIAEVLVDEGMRVQAGQVLARLDASNLEASLKLAEAQAQAAQAALAETQVRLELAEREWRRIQELADTGVASEADLDQARAEVNSLRARLERQRAEVAVGERQVAVLLQQLEDLVIRAPFDGVVTTKDAQPGEMVSPVSAGGGFTRTGICTIVDMTSLEIEVDVNESFINRVQPGQPVEAVLDAYPDWKMPARVKAIIPTADRQKATVKVRVSLEALDPRILPQMGVKVAFRDTVTVAAGKPLVTVPKDAVQTEQGRSVVWVVSQGRAERRAVTLGERRNDELTVLAGLAVGERVATSNLQALSDGARVKELAP